jgi:hypothetical protein
MTKQLILALLVALALTGCPQRETPAGIDASADNAVSAGARAKIKTTMEGIKKACQQFNAQEGTWPADMQALVDSGIWADGDRADPWGNDYVIRVEGNRITVLTYGADGEEGGEGRDTDFSID